MKGLRVNASKTKVTWGQVSKGQIEDSGESVETSLPSNHHSGEKLCQGFLSIILWSLDCDYKHYFGTI